MKPSSELAFIWTIVEVAKAAVWRFVLSVVRR